MSAAAVTITPMTAEVPRLSPASRVVLNSVFLHDAVEAGLDSAIVNASKIEPLNRIGEQWSMQVVMELAAGPKRFSEIKRALDGVSQRMLTLSLRGLERDGLVTRTVTPTIPPRVDYELTDVGQSLREPVVALGQWVLDHLDCINAAQRRYDAEHDEE